MVGLGEAASGSAAFGADWGRLPVGMGLCVGVDMLLEQPGDQIPPQVDGPFLTLIEGDELVLVFGAEHQVEGGAAVAEEARAEFLTAGSGIGLRIVQDGYARGLSNGQRRCG